MLDEALLYRSDFSIGFDLHIEKQIKDLLQLTLSNGQFSFDLLIKSLKNLKDYHIPAFNKTLIIAIKRRLFSQVSEKRIINNKINTSIWKQLAESQKVPLKK